jgi:WD40 repeat protein
MTPKPGYAAGNILNMLVHLGADLTGYDFSGLSVWQVYLQGVELRNWSVAKSDLNSAVFADNFDTLTMVDLSRDGRFLATGTGSGQILVWQTDTFTRLRVLEGHKGWINSVAYHPSGNLIASTCTDSTTRIWDSNTGDCIKVFPCTSVYSVTHNGIFSPNGRMFVFVRKKSIYVWDLNIENDASVLSVHSDRISEIAFSPDGRFLASCSEDCTIYLWETGNFQIYKGLHGHKSSVRCIAFSSDGQILASGSQDGTVCIWNVMSGKSLKVVQEHEDAVNTVIFNPDSQILASASRDKTIHIWNLTTKNSPAVLRGHTDSISGLAFDFNSTTCASAGLDTTIRLWDTNTFECRGVLQGHDERIEAIIFHPDKHVLVSCGNDQRVCLWDTEKVQPLKFLRGYMDYAVVLAFTNEGENILSANRDLRTVHLWNTLTGQLIKTLTIPSQSGIWTSGSNFNSDEIIVAEDTKSKTICLWDLSKRECVGVLQSNTSSPVR